MPKQSCPHCGQKVDKAKFCSQCQEYLEETNDFLLVEGNVIEDYWSDEEDENDEEGVKEKIKSIIKDTIDKRGLSSLYNIDPAKLAEQLHEKIKRIKSKQAKSSYNKPKESDLKSFEDMDDREKCGTAFTAGLLFASSGLIDLVEINSFFNTWFEQRSKI